MAGARSRAAGLFEVLTGQAAVSVGYRDGNADRGRDPERGRNWFSQGGGKGYANIDSCRAHTDRLVRSAGSRLCRRQAEFKGTKEGGAHQAGPAGVAIGTIAR